jgi:hypothetical protein
VVAVDSVKEVRRHGGRERWTECVGEHFVVLAQMLYDVDSTVAIDPTIRGLSPAPNPSLVPLPIWA